MQHLLEFQVSACQLKFVDPQVETIPWPFNVSSHKGQGGISDFFAKNFAYINTT